MNVNKSLASDSSLQRLVVVICAPRRFIRPLVNVAEVRVLLVRQVLESMHVTFVLRPSSVSLLVETGQVKPQGDNDEQ